MNLDSYIKDKTLVFTITSDGYKYLTWNLWKMIQEKKLPWKLCILCLDRESNYFFNTIAMIPSRLYLMDGPKVQHKTPTLFSTPPFKRMNRMKLKALETLSQDPAIEHLIYLDSDIAIFSDPLPYLVQKLEEFPLWFQCDEKNANLFECTNVDQCSNPCSGVIAMKCNDETRKLYKSIYSIHPDTWASAVTDQDYISARMKDQKIIYKTLSKELFPNGTLLKDNLYKEKNPYLLHFNYIMGSQKQQMMKQKGCWLIEV